jgi:Phage integrase, N-terminal SAM-like domain
VQRVGGHCAARRVLAPSKQTVADFADEWLATIKATIRPSTLDKYRRDIRVKVVPNTGAVPLTKLDGPILNRL